MKRSDIIIGQEYAQARGDWEYDHGTASRVRVIGEAEVQQGYGHRAKTVKGLEIEFLERDGSVTQVEHRDGTKSDKRAKVTGRQIREPWAEYQARWTKIRQARLVNERARRSAIDERAERLLDIIPALLHAGIPDERSYSYDDTTVAALERHVPEIFDHTEEGGRQSYFNGPLASSYAGYVQHGHEFKVKVDVLLAALR